MIRKVFNWLLICILAGGNVNAQNFLHRTRVDSVLKTGFYEINVTPALSALTRTDFSDLRIMDTKGNPVPYLLGSEIAMRDSAQFTSLFIVQNSVNDSGHSVLIVENKKKEKLDELYLRIKNAAVNRTLGLSGSEDGEHWYSIMENLNLEKRFIQGKDSFMEKITFPLSGYHFFRIIIYNGKNDPLNILSAYKKNPVNLLGVDSVLINPGSTYTRRDSTKTTWLNIDNAGRYHVNYIFITVKGPRFYRRQLDVITREGLVGSFLVSADSVIQLRLPLFNDSAFRIRIYNEDNPPLDIAGISMGQSAEKIIAYLEAGKSYELEMTCAEATKPNYDLVNFKEFIPMDVKGIGLSEIVSIPSATPSGIGLKSFWLWPVLILVLVALGLFTFRLTREMAKRS